MIETGNQPPSDLAHSEPGSRQRLVDRCDKLDFLNPGGKRVCGCRERSHHVDHHDDASGLPCAFDTFNDPNDQAVIRPGSDPSFREQRLDRVRALSPWRRNRARADADGNQHPDHDRDHDRRTRDAGRVLAESDGNVSRGPRRRRARVFGRVRRRDDERSSRSASRVTCFIRTSTTG